MMRASAALGKATQGLFALVGTSLAGKSRDEAPGKQFMGELWLRRHGQEAVCRIFGEPAEERHAAVVGDGQAAGYLWWQRSIVISFIIYLFVKFCVIFIWHCFIWTKCCVFRDKVNCLFYCSEEAGPDIGDTGEKH